MAQIAGSPFRGCAAIHIENDVDPDNNKRAYSISITDIAPEAPGDQASWTFDPASSGEVIAVTIRFEWSIVGAPLAGAADTGVLRVRVPGGGADIGATVALAPVGDSGSQTFTLRFDANPLDGAVDAARWGTVELLFQVSRAAVVAWGPADSRGAYAAPIAATHNDWAQGYIRRTARLDAYSISNVALGGAEPGLWAFPDPIHQRLTLDAVCYESSSLDPEIRRDGNGTLERSGPASATAAVRDFSWTGTAGTNRRIGNGMQLASDLKEIRPRLAAADFGGDNKFIWAAAGQQAGFVFVSDLVILNDARITVDPQLTVAHLAQANTDVFAAPPLSLDDTTRSTSDLFFLSCRFRNANGTGQNILTADLKMWDAGQLTGSEASPTNSVSGRNTDTNGGEAGWLESTSSKVPLSWDEALPGGSWSCKTVIVTPVDAVGLEANTATRTVTLLAVNPNLAPQCDAGSARIAGHMVVGDTLGIVFWVFDMATDQLAVITTPAVRLLRVTNGRLQYYSTALDWVDLTGAALADAHAMTETVPGTSRLYSTSFATPATKWTERDTQILCKGFVDTLPYAANTTVEMAASASDHGRAVQLLLVSRPGVVAAAGDHWHVGEDLLINAALFDQISETLVAADASPAPSLALIRINEVTGRAEYLKADFTWANIPLTSELAATAATGTQVLTAATTSITVADTTAFPASGTLLLTLQGTVFQKLPYTGKTATTFTGITGGNGVLSAGGAVTEAFDASLHTMTATTDPRVFTKSFTAAQASAANGWNDRDITIFASAFQNTRKILASADLTVITVGVNEHDGYALDSVGLALHGILSQR
jgi:hypothetical protein